MAQIVYDEAYEKDLWAYFDEQMPEKVYDAHFHLSHRYSDPKGYVGNEYGEYAEFMAKYIPRSLAGGLVMAQPSSKHGVADVDKENARMLEIAEEHDLRVGVIITPACGREKVERLLDTYPRITALKPYLTYTTTEDMFESDITDFAPLWMWELANERRLPVILHLSHYQNMLNDPKNIEQVRYLSVNYPHAKIVLAHCAMGHHCRKLQLGLEKIKDLKNIWFDCSGSVEALSIYYCLKTFGVERMLYGADHNHGANVGRICSFGSNFIGFHPGYLNEEAVPPDYRYQPLNNAQEGLLALLQACELLALSDDDKKRIFYDNAAELYGG